MAVALPSRPIANSSAGAARLLRATTIDPFAPMRELAVDMPAVIGRGAVARCAAGRDRKHRHRAAIFGVEVDRGAVARPARRVDAAIEVVGQAAGSTGCAVQHHQPPLVRFVARLAPVSDRRWTCRQASRPARRRSPDSSSAVSAPSLPSRPLRRGRRSVLVASTASVTAGEADRAAVGGEGDRMRPLAFARRHVVVRAGRQIARRSARRRDDEQMHALAVAPRRPVTEQQAIVDPRLDRILLSLVRPRLVARVVLAIWKHVGA